DDPTQWLFHGRPEHSSAPLQVAVARLLGYRWPAELDEEMQLSPRAHELARRSEDLLPHADKDSLVCLPPVRGESSAADRLLKLLIDAYGDAWTNDVLPGLLKEAGYAGKSLEVWLRDGFFAQHCELFHQRPFIWHIWDGLPDGFAALANYHRLDRKNLETLIYTYLGWWITHQMREQEQGVDGAGERLAGAEQLKKRLELILKGEAPYDIFVRWKPLHEQPLGWSLDLNDGVRMNIHPFVSVPDVKYRGAGVLRVKPNIKWNKDRGKEPKRPREQFPWFWGWDGSENFLGGPNFTGERFNDCHYTLAVKRQAREQIKVEAP
ncbi:MAG: SAM-dependent DNA methyltransferase, partial [Planctomycetes bacterium]|nr:SAM-dependent DNA methyltransferase [Planctomycetota bacterium]